MLRKSLASGHLGSRVLILPVLLIVFAAGCSSSLRLSTDYDSEADFSEFSTFDWADQAQDWPESFFDSALRGAVNRELEAVGLSQNADNPNLLVITHTNVREVISGATVTHWNHGWGWYAGWGGMGTSTMQVHQHTEGTLVLDLVDASRNQLVWRGVAEKAIRDVRSTREQLQPIINSLLQDFPPASTQ
jgi:hypothetical protein